MRKRFIPFVFAALLPRLAAAQDADKLFTEASALAEQGKYAEACPKFEESQRLDPALGTQFNLALCYEHVGKLGSAWRNYAEVERLARATGKKTREEAAHTRMTALKPRVAHLVLKPVQADVEVKVDGALADRSAWSFYAVDAGEHVIDATASARKPWRSHASVLDGAEVVVAVPALSVAAGKTITVETEKTNVRRVLGFVMGGIGLVGIGAAVTTGVIILDAKSTANKDCTLPSPNPDQLACATQTGRDAVARGKTLIPINAVAWAVGGAALAGGVILLLTSGSKKPAGASATIVPLMAPGEGGISLSGSFW